MLSEGRSNVPVKQGSNRSFGLVFSVFFLVIGLYPLISAAPLRPWALGIAAAFLLVSLLYPALLSPLNRVWFHFGLLLHKIVSPLTMGLIFFAVFTPMALCFRILGKDPMRRTRLPGDQSYWIPRSPPGPEGASLKNMF